MYYVNITIFYNNNHRALESKLHHYLLKSNLTLFRKFTSKKSMTFHIGKVIGKRNQWTFLMDRTKYYTKRIARIAKKRIITACPPEDIKYLKFTITKEIVKIKKDFRSYDAVTTPNCNIRF